MNQRVLEEYLGFVIGSVAEKARASSDFLLKFLKEDDWSFIIKTHALLESIISELLTSQTKDERLHKVFRRLELNNDLTGKLAFIKALELLEPEQRYFIRTFSELRNSLVHNIENVSFSLNSHVAKLDKQQKKSWQDALTWFATEEPEKQTWRKMALKDPKTTVWMSVFMLALSLQMNTVKTNEIGRLHNLGHHNAFIDLKELNAQIPKQKKLRRLTTRSS